MLFITNLQEGNHIQSIYLCSEKTESETKTGQKYISVILQDKTGSIDGKIWDVTATVNFKKNDYVKIDAVVQKYKENLQLNINNLEVVQVENESDYVPTTRYPIAKMYTLIIKEIDTIENPYLSALCKSFFVEDKNIVKNFCGHSAAKSIHHAFKGGLLQHTLWTTRLCSYLSKIYPLNHDLLITAAMLHDIGKLKELSSFPENDYTDEGELLGHIVIGIEMIDEKIKQIQGFPSVLALELKHCILSHHGEYEYGSPKKPAMLEALVLHLADSMDSKIENLIETLNIESDTDWYEWGYRYGSKRVKKAKGTMLGLENK